MDKAVSKDVAEVIADYPVKAYAHFISVRALVVKNAAQVGGMVAITETLKWGEPSYLVKSGSTVRIAWTEKHPQQFSLYFNCNSKLVETFRSLYSHELRFDKNRAINLALDEPIPADAIRHCVLLAMKYHKLKHLSLLGE